MNSINLYQPSSGLDLETEFPAAWDELEQPELEIISSELINPEKEDPATGRVNILMKMLQYRFGSKRLKPTLLKKININDLATQGIDAIRFLFDGVTLTKTPAISITYGLFGHAMEGPKQAFKAITAGEYEDAGVFAHKFSEDPKIEHLHMLVAILWRPAGMAYEYKPRWAILKLLARHRYATVDQRLKLVRKLSPATLYTTMIWFTGCSGLLPKYFPLVYAKSGGEEAGDIMAFTKCIHAGAGVKNGTRHQVRRTLLLEFLLDLQLEMEANKKMEEDAKRHS